MAYKKTVWVIDIYDYLTVLNGALDQLVPRYPWLQDTASINERWVWLEHHFGSDGPHRTQRDFLLDWIIREEIHEMFYLMATNHLRGCGAEDYEIIYNELRTHLDIGTYTLQHIFLPNVYRYGDLHPGRIWRQQCWLYVECEVTQQTLEQYALQPNATVRNPPKHPY